jgi:hypothetical protein
MDNVVISLVVGFVLGVIVTALVVKSVIDSQKGRTIDRSKVNRVTTVALTLLAGVFMFAQVMPTLAQTPVPITIPTDIIFTEANNWIETFAPIAAIGIGISIALAVLGYLGKMIIGAFKS